MKESKIDEGGFCKGCGVKVNPTEEDPSWDYCECPSLDLEEEFYEEETVKRKERE